MPYYAINKKTIDQMKAMLATGDTEKVFELLDKIPDGPEFDGFQVSDEAQRIMVAANVGGYGNAEIHFVRTTRGLAEVLEPALKEAGVVSDKQLDQAVMEAINTLRHNQFLSENFNELAFDDAEDKLTEEATL